MSKKEKVSIRNLFFKDTLDEQIAENFRLLRTNLHFIDNKPNRVVVVTSTIPKEGKSSIASNYAMSEAITGKKVLIIDCDIRRPRVHTTFGTKIEFGLSDVLTGKKEVEDVILKNIEKNLDLLPTKHLKHNITEIFLSKKMEETLEKLKPVYDIIILDTSPLTVVTDAVLLAEHADGIILVVGYGLVTKKELEYSNSLIKRSKANLYGVVMNKIDKSGYSCGNHGMYDYTHKYYDDYLNEK
ncbi:MAG: CpsD/CapB family tyrosine-protein kinase [Fusobacteriaceae bacterium]